MMKNFVVLLSMFALFEMATCRPSASTPDEFAKESRIELPGSERISKRSAETSTTIPLNIAPEDGSLQAMGGSSASETRALESSEDFEEAIGFRPIPVFRKRSVNQIETFKSMADNQETHKRFSRSSNIDDDSDDAMKTAENGLIFLPHFRSRNGVVRNQRSRRSAQDAVKTNVLLNAAEIGEDLEGADTIIFRPVFRTQLRPVRSVVEEDGLKNDMVAAANGLIFRPLFRTSRRGPGSI